MTRPRKSRSGTPTTRNVDRIRKIIQITLSDEARARLDSIAVAIGESRSRVVEALLLGEMRASPAKD